MSVTVADLVERFDSGEIRLPLMQRDYVWKPKKVARLLDSLYRGWPIGSFYVWNTQDTHPTKAPFGKLVPKKLDSFYGFLLDGQQRLTSLALAIQGDAAAELTHRAFFDLENERFYLGQMKRTITKRIEAGDALVVPLSEIVTTSKAGDSQLLESVERIIQALGAQGKLGRGDKEATKYRERLHRLASMLRKDALCDQFTDDHEEDAFEVFSRLNKGGTSLSAGDVEAARLASAATKKIVEPMRAFVAEPDKRALGLNFVFLLRTLVTVHRGNCSFSKLPRSWADDTAEVEESWRRTQKALRATVDFIREEVGWVTRRWLPSTMALIPVVYMLAKSNTSKLHGKDADLVKRYLLITGLRSLFRGSTETAVNSYVNAVRNTRGDRSRLARALFAKIPKNRLYKIKKDDVRSASGMYSPLMQIYLAYLHEKGVRSWSSGRRLKDALRERLSCDPLGVHHIFPKKFMQDQDFPLERLNTVANYAILLQADNAELGDQNPLDMWGLLNSDQREWASRQLGFLAQDTYLKPEAFEEFIDFRAEKMAGWLNEFLGFGRREK